ncbi:AraC-like DNA-binding protein [Lentzea atacamensis]|uniref:AraC-like DNA-binding protein n=1 Tax=Lentzea atacamensis TaxID=531938 RepID=A0ABX9DY49_9PSEU|nr:AraC-like DNA-binding protein [Lentzea atacamensis]
MPDQPHTHLVCGAYRLDRGHAHPFLRTLPEVLHLRSRPGRHPALRAAVDLLGADVTEAKPGAGAALPALLDLLLVYLLRAWLDEESARRPGAGWCAAFTDPVVATALSNVHQNPAPRWTVTELAGKAGLSKTAFARRFTALVGQAPMSYLTWWRLSTGARLLLDGDDTLASVARKWATRPSSPSRPRSSASSAWRPAGSAGQRTRMTTVPAALSCRHRPSESQTSAGISGKMRTVRSSARGRCTKALPSMRATRSPNSACPGVNPKKATATTVMTNQASRLQLRGSSGLVKSPATPAARRKSTRMANVRRPIEAMEPGPFSGKP